MWDGLQRRHVRRKPALPLLSEGSITAQRLTRRDDGSAKSVLKTKPAARFPRILADSPSQHSALEDTEASNSMPKSEKVTVDGNGSRPFKSVVPARGGQASSENVVDSGRPISVTMAAASGKHQQNMQPCPTLKGARMRGEGKIASVSETAVWKLAHLETASSASLNELERLIEEQYYQVALLSPVHSGSARN